MYIAQARGTFHENIHVSCRVYMHLSFYAGILAELNATKKKTNTSSRPSCQVNSEML